MKQNILSGLLMLGCGIAYSNPPHPHTDFLKTNSNYFSSMHPFAVITSGFELIQAGKAQTLNLLPPFSNHYTDSSSYQSAGLLGWGLGLEKALSADLFLQLGLSGYFNTAIKSQGHIWQFALPEFDNLLYRYDIQSKQMMVTGKLLSTVATRIHPYIAGELGAGFNQAYAYSETPLLEEIVPMAPFTNHTQTSLAWGAGIGLDLDINQTLRLGAGYHFADLGKTQLGLSSAQQTAQVLNIPHTYSHQIRLQLTALI